jgi:uncharacterized protein YhaN
MRIDRLEIKNFGKFDNLSIRLNQGLNIIYGNNEAGKTTIQWFIKGMFFNLKGGRVSKEGTMPPLKRFKPWRGNEFSGLMDYRLDNGETFRVERNFSSGTTRIYDSLFNEITNNFELARDKGPLFAEKHFGLNEACFDRTVFIKQMESKIDEDGNKELLGRLANLSQTGFEDVSFRKAQEALKEALKLNVGTGKTSVRPMDMVVLRLSKLKAKEKELIEKRETLFEVERELRGLLELKQKLEKERLSLCGLIDLLKVKAACETKKRLKNTLEKIVQQIMNDEEEYKGVLASKEGYDRLKDKYERFSLYSNDDIDEMDSFFNLLTKQKVENEKLEKEITYKKKDIERINFEIKKGQKGLNLQGSNIEKEGAVIDSELGELKNKTEKNAIEIINEKISSIQNKKNSRLLGSVVFMVLSAISFSIGILKSTLGYVGGAAFIIASILFLIFKNNENNKIYELLEEKRVSLTSAQISSINCEIANMQDTLSENTKKIIVFSDAIKEKLLETGVITNLTREINEEVIREFKSGVRNYKGLEPSLKYASQKISDINKNKEERFKSFSLVSGCQCYEKEHVQKALENLSEDIKKLESDMITKTDQTVDINQQSKDFLNILQDYNEMGADKLEESLNSSYQKVEEDKIAISMKIIESETLLRSFNEEGDELQKTVEEIGELEVKKFELEQMYLSLKTALEVLTEASVEIQKDFIPVLNNKMGGIIEKISGGRYIDLRADKNLKLKVVAPETGDVVSAMHLSGGTVDQMYLALRMAAADVLSQTHERLIIIMDEVFSQYDDIRTGKAFEYLSFLAEDRQIIFFTCKSREVQIAKNKCSKTINIVELAN